MKIYQNVNKLTSLGHFYFLYFLEFSKFSAVNIYYFCDLKAIKIKINFEFIGKWKTDQDITRPNANGQDLKFE